MYQVYGVIQEIKPDTKQITIAHEDIPGFMPAMTMGFYLKDESLAKGIQKNDRIRFTFRHIDSRFLISSMAKAADQETPKMTQTDEPACCE